MGAVRECERDTPRREGKLAALAFPSLLRVSLSRSPFPDPLTPKCEPAAFIAATFSLLCQNKKLRLLGEKEMRKKEREGKT